MFKTAIKQGPLLFCCVFVSFLCAIIQSSTVHAATQQTQTSYAGTPSVTLSQTGQADPAHAIGHPGTPVTISIKNFTSMNTPSTVNLYTTTDPAQCIANGTGLEPFTNYTPLTTDTMGNKDLTNVPWPNNANQATTVYYVCAISTAPPGLQAVSTQSFTVAQPATVTAASPTIQPGTSLTLTGANWLPAQQIMVEITANRASGQSIVFVQGTTNSDNAGNFTVSLTIPANIAPGSYAISAAATNEPTLTFQQDNLLTVTAPSPTPTAAPSPTPTATPPPTPTPKATATPTTTGSNTNSNSGGGGGNGLTTVLIFTLGGLGILLIVIGVIMFAASSPTAPAIR